MSLTVEHRNRTISTERTGEVDFQLKVESDVQIECGCGERASVRITDRLPFHVSGEGGGTLIVQPVLAKPTRKRIERDAQGRATAVVEAV
jgi:hypothetical protein